MERKSVDRGWIDFATLMVAGLCPIDDKFTNS